MSLTFLLYLFFVFDSIVQTVVKLSVFMTLFFGICWLASVIGKSEADGSYYRNEEVIKNWKNRVINFTKSFKTSAIVTICVILFVTFLPNSKQIAALAATSYAVDLVKSPEGEKVLQVVRGKANEYLDELLQETNNTKEKHEKETKSETKEPSDSKSSDSEWEGKAQGQKETN